MSTEAEAKLYTPVKSQPPRVKWLPVVIECRSGSELTIVRSRTAEALTGLLSQGGIADAVLTVHELTGNAIDAKHEPNEYQSRIRFGIVAQTTVIDAKTVIDTGSVIAEVCDNNLDQIPDEINLKPENDVDEHRGLPMVIGLNGILGHYAMCGEFTKGVWTVVGSNNLN